MLLLTDHLGVGVADSAGRRIGRLADVVAQLGGDCPASAAVVVACGHGVSRRVDWADVASFERAGVLLRPGAEPGVGTDRTAALALAPAELALAHDVLDRQIFDVVGRRVVRAADVVMEREGALLRVVGVEVGTGAVLRRLGLRALARRMPSDAIAWQDLHVASGRGHRLQLHSEAAAVHRMAPAELAHLLAQVPTAAGAETLLAVRPAAAAGALAVSRPDVGARLVAGLPAEHAAPMVEHMAADDATAALRLVGPGHVDALLGHVSGARAAELRRLLAHPPETAGGLMSPEVRRIGVNEPLAALRRNLASHPPSLESLATVFVVDDDGRPTAMYGPTALALPEPVAVPVRPVHCDEPVSAVIDRFAVEDVLALPVVDDTGRLVGAIAVDDVLDELVVERLPGRRRFWQRGRRGGRRAAGLRAP